MRGPTRPRCRKADAAPGPPLNTKVSGRFAPRPWRHRRCRTPPRFARRTGRRTPASRRSPYRRACRCAVSMECSLTASAGSSRSTPLPVSCCSARAGFSCGFLACLGRRRSRGRRRGRSPARDARSKKFSWHARRSSGRSVPPARKCPSQPRPGHSIHYRRRKFGRRCCGPGVGASPLWRKLMRPRCKS